MLSSEALLNFVLQSVKLCGINMLKSCKINLSEQILLYVFKVSKVTACMCSKCLYSNQVAVYPLQSAQGDGRFMRVIHLFLTWTSV